MRLAYWQKLLYAAGSLGVTLSYQAFATYIQFLYIDILGLKATLVATGWSLYGVWNAINDPLAGYWSDNTRTRWGRRIPWIAGAFIPVGLLFYLLWVPPSPLLAGGDTPLFVYFMAVVLVFDLLWTIIVMNWTALFPEMISDEKERATVSGWRQVFSILGLSGYVASTAANLFPEQPASAVLGIRVMTALVPVLASFVVVWCLERYPLHGDWLKAMRDKMAAMR